MIGIICYLLGAYGLSNLLVYGSGPWNVLGKIREFTLTHIQTIGEMLECMMCTSTNIGWVISLLNIFIFPEINFTPFNTLIDDTSLWWLIIISDAVITSGAVWLLHTCQEALERWNS